MRVHEIPVDQCAGLFTNPYQVVRVRPIARVVYEAVFDRIGMDVTAQLQQVVIIGDDCYPVSTFKLRAGVVATLVVDL